MAATWRYIDAVLIDNTSSNPLITGGYNQVDKELKAQNYLDLAASWNINKKLTLSGGINNITDEEPPLVGATLTTNANTVAGFYDTLGMFGFVNVTFRF